MPVHWTIANGKAAGNPPATGKVDAVDFTEPAVWPNGVGAPPPVGSGTGGTVSKVYKGSAFIVSWDDLKGEDPAALTALLNTWRTTHGVVIDVAKTTFTAPDFVKLTSWPHVILDAQNGKLVQPFYTNAAIPQTQAVAVPPGAPTFTTYIFKAPPQLNACDDIYVMPHADPTWATHSN